MKALELAFKQEMYVKGVLGDETAAELRRLAEVNAELRAALEKIESSEINGVQAILKARAALAKEQQ